MESDLEGEAVVLRPNLDEGVGKQTACRFGVGIPPTFVVFLADGGERHRASGLPNITLTA